MSEKGQDETGTPLGAADGAAAGAATGAEGGAAAGAAAPFEYGQGLQSFQPEINVGDYILDANSQVVDADAIGGSPPSPDSGELAGQAPSDSGNVKDTEPM
jgi:hypothetical protein